MNTQNHLGFITTKIEELETAVLHSHSNNVLNIKSTLVKTMQVDENGNIWFTIRKPLQEITQFESQFPVGLNYYKKGTSFFLNVFGVARIINDPEELTFVDMNNHIKKEIDSDHVLVCVKIMNANYYEKESSKKTNWLHKFKNAIVGIFLNDDNYYMGSANDHHQLA